LLVGLGNSSSQAPPQEQLQEQQQEQPQEQQQQEQQQEQPQEDPAQMLADSVMKASSAAGASAASSRHKRSRSVDPEVPRAKRQKGKLLSTSFLFVIVRSVLLLDLLCPSLYAVFWPSNSAAKFPLVKLFFSKVPDTVWLADRMCPIDFKQTTPQPVLKQGTPLLDRIQFIPFYRSHHHANEGRHRFSPCHAGALCCPFQNEHDRTNLVIVL
jgi:hypothetical protein